MGKPTTCGHEPYCAKGLCTKCYDAARYQPKARKPPRVTTCGHPVHCANGLCQACYDQSRRIEKTARLMRWRKENPDRMRAHKHNENARRRTRRASGSVSTEQWWLILVEFDFRCAYCNRGDLPLTQDHMSALSRGGSHTVENVVPACGPCNYSKGAKSALEFVGPLSA